VIGALVSLREPAGRPVSQALSDESGRALLRAPQAGRAEIAVFDVSGRRLATVLDREVEPGVHRVPWAGRDASDRPLPVGLYLYRARQGLHEARGALIIAR